MRLNSVLEKLKAKRAQAANSNRKPSAKDKQLPLARLDEVKDPGGLEAKAADNYGANSGASPRK